MKFEIIKKGTYYKERIGKLHLPYGEVETPVFMPVGTQGMIKTLSHTDVENLGYNLILNNTYHLYLRPGIDVLKSFGGIRNLTKWKGNLLTDSGGFQVYSLSSLRKIQENGIHFSSHIDGSKHFFTPEKVIEIQNVIKSDIIMPLDICSPINTNYDEAVHFLNLTLNWAKRSKFYLKNQTDDSQILFGIVQGNFYKDLRKKCIEQLAEIDFPGYSIGGLSVGEGEKIMYEITDYCTSHLPVEKPVYLMGVGEPVNILNCIELGVDMFDCVYPTRVARNATVFTENGKLLLKNKENEKCENPIENGCDCFTCLNYSRAYLRHLFKAKEIVALYLATIHNLKFMHNFIKKIKKSIISNNFIKFKEEFLKKYLNSN